MCLFYLFIYKDLKKTVIKYWNLEVGFFNGSNFKILLRKIY